MVRRVGGKVEQRAENGSWKMGRERPWARHYSTVWPTPDPLEANIKKISKNFKKFQENFKNISKTFQKNFKKISKNFVKFLILK